MGQHGKWPTRNGSRLDKKKPVGLTPMKLTGILTLILKLDQDQKTLGYLYCSVVAGEGISWPQRLVMLILSSLLLNGSVLDRSHKSRCCSSSAELIPNLKILQKWSTNIQLFDICITKSCISRKILLSNSREGVVAAQVTNSICFLTLFSPGTVFNIHIYTFSISKTQFQRHINVNI